MTRQRHRRTGAILRIIFALRVMRSSMRRTFAILKILVDSTAKSARFWALEEACQWIHPTSLECDVRGEKQAFERLTWQAEPRLSEGKPKNSCYSYLDILFLKVFGREYLERLRFFNYILNQVTGTQISEGIRHAGDPETRR